MGDNVEDDLDLSTIPSMKYVGENYKDSAKYAN